MKTRAQILASFSRLAPLALLCGGAACGQDPPPEPETGAYHPLVAGSWWEYEHDDWLERVTLEAATFEGGPAFSMSDSPNPNDDLRGDSIITNEGGRIARRTKEEYLIPATGGEPILRSSVDYGVGFTRFVEDWANQSVGFKESPAYVRVETPPGGAPGSGEDRRHIFEILSLSEEVTTPAGSFDCIKIMRTRDWQVAADGVDADAQTKIFWFARGVGKVKEENPDSGSYEVLSAYAIPEMSE